MTVRSIILFPDSRLKTVCAELAGIDAFVENLVDDLIDTLSASPGCVGIAAPQVGELVRLIVVDVSRGRKPVPNHGRLVLVNPRLTEKAGHAPGREGCLSIPQLTANVVRPESIVVEFIDRTGQPVRMETSGFEARVIAHEIDHLDGLLFLDRVSSLKTDVFRRKSATLVPSKPIQPASASPAADTSRVNLEHAT